jgi:SAM-dependent methyltransferase
MKPREEGVEADARLAEFDRWGTNYDDVLASTLGAAGSPDYYHRLKAVRVGRMLGPGFSGRLLDFGCGIGGLLCHLARELPASELVGFDPSPQSARLAAQIPGLSGVVTEENRLQPRSFDVVVISNVLHHIDELEQPSVMRRIHMLLRDGGRIVIIEHNPYNPLTRWWVVARCPFDEGVVLLRPRRIRQLLVEAGFQDLDQEFITFFPEPLTWASPLERFLGWLPLGAQVCTTGTR